jgi:exodeoxyribonuclease III
MKIATYNVNGVNGRIKNLLKWLEQWAPDVACLQELKAPDGGQKSWNGVAILARGESPF